MDAAKNTLELAEILKLGAFFLGGSFFIYGWASINSKHMKSEFRRYRLSLLRIPTGAIQILTSAVLIFGLLSGTEGLIKYSSAIFVMMMLVAVLIRFRIGDGVIKTIPAIFYFLLSVLIFSHECGFIY